MGWVGHKGGDYELVGWGWRWILGLGRVWRDWEEMVEMDG